MSLVMGSNMAESFVDTDRDMLPRRPTRCIMFRDVARLCVECKRVTNGRM